MLLAQLLKNQLNRSVASHRPSTRIKKMRMITIQIIRRRQRPMIVVLRLVSSPQKTSNLKSMP